MIGTGDFKARDWSAHPPYLLESYKSIVLRGPAILQAPLASFRLTNRVKR